MPSAWIPYLWFSFGSLAWPLKYLSKLTVKHWPGHLDISLNYEWSFLRMIFPSLMQNSTRICAKTAATSPSLYFSMAPTDTQLPPPPPSECYWHTRHCIQSGSDLYNFLLELNLWVGVLVAMHWRWFLLWAVAAEGTPHASDSISRTQAQAGVTMFFCFHLCKKILGQQLSYSWLTGFYPNSMKSKSCFLAALLL